MNVTKHLLNTFRLYGRRWVHTPQRETVVVRKAFEKLKQRQKMFQKDEGSVVWLKTKGDKLLYRTAVSLTGFLVGWSLVTFWQLSFAKHFK